MADLIDIEEHNILDNPVIRRIFPDILTFKKEILEFNDEALIEETSIDDVQQEVEDHPIIVIDESNVPSLCLSNEPENEYLSDGNIFTKIDKEHLNDDCTYIVQTKRHVYGEQLERDSHIKKSGNIQDTHVGKSSLLETENTVCKIYEKKVKQSNVRPQSSRLKETDKLCHSLNLPRNYSLPSKQSEISNQMSLAVLSIDKSSDHCANTFCTPPFIQRKFSDVQQPNDITIGLTVEDSKPKHSHLIALNTEASEKQKNIYNAKILIENIEIFLSKSNRYCKTCMTLFPTYKTFTDHQNLIHSQLILSQSNNCNRVLKNKTKLNVNSNCNVCNTVSSSSRRKRCIHSLNVKKKITETNHDIQLQANDKLNEEVDDFKCSHCDNRFPTQQTLIDHMYKVLNTITMDDTKAAENKKNMCPKSRDYYMCYFCSYYFKQQNNYVNHLKNNHKETAKIKLKKVVFDPLCKYCFNKYSTAPSFNVHVAKRHRKQLYLDRNILKMKVPKVPKIFKCTNNSKSKLQANSTQIKVVEINDKVHHMESKDMCRKYILKSIIFKCIECDVCFLNGTEAANHIRHAAKETNWKCLKCLQIFKIEDQNKHTQQHLYGDNFEVLNVCENTYKYILCQCPNCATYFQEKDFFNHYSLCEVQPPDAAYCKTCHILIDNKIMEVHDTHHKTMGDKKLKNILVESDVITANEGTIYKLRDSFELSKRQSEHIESNEGMNNKIQETTNINHKLFVNIHKVKDSFDLRNRQSEHIESNEGINNKTQVTTTNNHKRLGNIHEVKDLFISRKKQPKDKESNEGISCKIKETTNIAHKQLGNNELIKSIDESVDTNNTEIDNNKDIEEEHSMTISKNKHCLLPASKNARTRKTPKNLLRFIYCGTCKCFIFVSRVRKLYNHIKARCVNLINYVCKYCGLVLSNKAINSHRKLHQDVPGLTLSDFRFYDLKSSKEIAPPLPKYPNCHLCKKHFITKTAIISHVCSEDYVPCRICKIKLSEAAFPLHMSFHNYLPNKPKLLNGAALVAESIINLSEEPNSTSVTKFTNLLESHKNCEFKHLLVFTCKICKVTVDTYAKVIEHCHLHITSQDVEILTKPCVSCNLIFDVTCFQNHKMLHSGNLNKNFSVLTYDAFYVTAKDNIWLNHLFGSLSRKEISSIVGNSIYSFERRIRMQILQDGTSDLTIYKCAKCNSFIDPSSVYDHCQMDILCYKSKSVPCSICGIPLTPEQFLSKHEKVHESQAVSASSYRIILFNSDDDKTVNHILSMPRQYILYECRNCNGLVDNKRFKYHKCDFNDLLKCSHCGLLLYSKDYMPHVVKHKEFCSYQEDNICVILLGVIENRDVIKFRLKSSFRGTKLDYIFYKCNKCQICLKDKQSSLTHDCVQKSALTKCVTCELYFEDSIFKNHRKLHERDLYFTKENISVVELGLESSRSSDEDIIVIDD